MKAARFAATVAGVVLAIILAAFLAGLFQRLLIAGARLAQDMGDTVIITDEDVIGGDGEAAPFATEPPAATWPPGDDPSWSEDMPQVPVDRTADELAEDLKN